MRTIVINAPRGLQTTLLDILKPIKMNTSPLEDKYWSQFEFIGTIDCPHARLKNFGKGVFESIVLVSSAMGSYEKTY